MLLGHQSWTSELSTYILHEFFSTEKNGYRIWKTYLIVFFFTSDVSLSGFDPKLFKTYFVSLFGFFL